MGLALVPESAQTLRFEGVVFRPIRLRPEPSRSCTSSGDAATRIPALRLFRNLIAGKLMDISAPAPAE